MPIALTRERMYAYADAAPRPVSDCKGVPTLSRSAATKAGLDRARKAGKKLGGRRARSHVLTTQDRSKGGKVAAVKRRQNAQQRYEKWVWSIRVRREDGFSWEQIAIRLRARGVKAPKGGRLNGKAVRQIMQMADAGR